MKKYLEKISKKKWLIMVIMAILVASIFFVLVKKYGTQYSIQSEIKIGWVTDIHADRFKKRDVDSGKLYPIKYTEYLPKAFDAMKADGVNVVIATGDNTNSGDDNYARDIKKITDEKKMDVLWVKGNHDNGEVMNILGVPAPYYYFKDYGNTRIVVLNSTEYQNDEYNYEGGIGQEQLTWLREVLKTEKKIIVAMHIPIFDSEIEKNNIHDLKGEFFGVGNIFEKFVELENILKEKGNVKMVLSGHWHVMWKKEYNGINYFGQSALTRDGGMGAYGTIKLEGYQLDYKFAN